MITAILLAVFAQSDFPPAVRSELPPAVQGDHFTSIAHAYQPPKPAPKQVVTPRVTPVSAPKVETNDQKPAVGDKIPDTQVPNSAATPKSDKASRGTAANPAPEVPDDCVLIQTVDGGWLVLLPDGRIVKPEQVKADPAQKHGSPSGLALDFKPEPKTKPEATAPADDRQWFELTSPAGYFGYGRKNEQGEVVVEWYCQAGTVVVRRGPLLLPARVTYYAAPAYQVQVACPPTGCPQQFAPAYTMRQGFFRGIFSGR